MPPDHSSSYFRICSLRRLSQSSSLLPLHSSGTVPNRSEGTFERLPILFGRPPQSNSPSDIVPQPGYGCRLETQYCRVVSKVGSMATVTISSLPHLSNMTVLTSVSNWEGKAPWALSVLAQVTQHLHWYFNFTGVLLRQCPNHYAFSFLKSNSSDKEFPLP